MGTSYSPRTVTNGLVWCLDAANAKSYPGSGTLWYDISGNANNATLTNAAMYVARDMVFNGSTYYTAQAYTHPSATQMTIEVWVKSASAIQATTIVSKWGALNLGRYSWMLFTDLWVAGEMNFLVGNATGQNYGRYNVSHNIAPNVFAHFVVTYNAGIVAIYKNGEALSGTITGVIPTVITPCATPLSLGCDYDGTTTDVARRFRAGSIPFVRIYSSILTADEVAQNFNALRGRFGI
jgi:hypothetical protein